MYRQRNQGQLALIAAVAIATMLGAGFNRTAMHQAFAPSARGARRGSAWSKPHDGQQERARRQRQILRGQLTESNGLVS